MTKVSKGVVPYIMVNLVYRKLSSLGNITMMVMLSRLYVR